MWILTLIILFSTSYFFLLEWIELKVKVSILLKYISESKVSSYKFCENIQGENSFIQRVSNFSPSIAFCYELQRSSRGIHSSSVQRSFSLIHTCSESLTATATTWRDNDRVFSSCWKTGWRKDERRVLKRSLRLRWRRNLPWASRKDRCSRELISHNLIIAGKD